MLDEDPGNYKAHMRRGMAFHHLGLHAEAM